MVDPRIIETIPHRPPFLFVDEIVEVSDGKITARRTVRADEEYFQGHYPGQPLMPGVLICEAVFQSSAILMGMTLPAEELAHNFTPVLTRIRDAKFRRAVRPGEVLELEVELVDRVGQLFNFKGKAKVDGKDSVRVSFSCFLVDEEP